IGQHTPVTDPPALQGPTNSSPRSDVAHLQVLAETPPKLHHQSRVPMTSSLTSARRNLFSVNSGEWIDPSATQTLPPRPKFEVTLKSTAFAQAVNRMLTPAQYQPVLVTPAKFGENSVTGAPFVYPGGARRKLPE